MNRHTPWHEQAACQGTEENIWYPEAQDNYNEARAICAQCPVKAECLTDALTAEGGAIAGMRYGMRAGLTPTQRWRIYRENAGLPPVTSDGRLIHNAS